MKIDNNLKNIFDSLYDGILIIDKNGIVLYTNPSYTRITKINKEDIENKRLLDVRKDSHLTKVMKTGIKEIGQYRTINKKRNIISDQANTSRMEKLHKNSESEKRCF